MFSCFIEDERFYERDGLCYKLMTQGPCNSNQLFFQDDGFEDNGICDCDNNLLLYANQTDECYEPNTQVFQNFCIISIFFFY